MERDRKRIFGLVGPSGIGKGFVKEVLLKSFPETFSELKVVTTRPVRPSDGVDRLPGLSPEQFLEMAGNGEILFAHQPFGESSHWYGFMASSFSGKKPVVTEVHVDNVKLFRGKFPSELLLIALIGDPEYLAANMKQRGDTSYEIEQRLKNAVEEVTAIALLHQGKLIDYVIPVNFSNRDTLANSVVNLISKRI